MTTARFICPHCDADFDSDFDLADHVKQAHAAPGVTTTAICPVCDEEFESREQLLTHGRLEHPGR